jgi:hypothetical protein
MSDPVAEIVRHLNLVTSDFEAGLIDRASYNRVRADYEARLIAARPPSEPEPEPAPAPEAAPAPAAFEAPAPVIVQPAPELPYVAAIEPVPEQPVAAITPEAPAEVPPAPAVEPPVAAIAPEPPAAPVAAIAVEPPAPVIPRPERPTAAIPPSPPGPTIGDMGRAVIGWAAERQADILLYAGAFMLSVAAVIFMAYQGEALSGNVRFAVLTAYALGFLGFGLWLHRWERVKEAAPVFLGLGAILVPIDFFALRTQVLDAGQVSNEMLWLLGSSSCSALYFALALRGYGKLYFAPAIPSALVAWGSLGAVLGLPGVWFGPWYLAAAAPAYTWSVAFRGKNTLSPWILAGSLVIATPALLLAQFGPLASNEHLWAAPAGYFFVCTAASAGLWWRRDIPVLALLPILGAAFAGNLAWAAIEPDPEWQIPFIAIAGLGYLVVAHFQDGERARMWAGAAAFAGAAALVFAHFVVVEPGTNPGVLPVTWALVFIGASGAYARWRWFEAAAAMPPAAAMVVLTTAWAAKGAGVEWYGVCAGIAPLGYLALAVFDRAGRREPWRYALAATALLGPAISHVALGTDAGAAHWSLAAAYAPPLAAAAVASGLWRFNWRPAPGALPPLAGMGALAVSWAQWNITPEWFASFAAAAAIGYVVLAWLDDPSFNRAWAGASLLLGALAIGGAHTGLSEPGANHWALAAAYALTLAAASAAFAKFRFAWSAPAGFVPPLAAMTALSSSWAQWDLAPEWYPSFAAAAALGYVALAWFEKPALRVVWAQFALGFGSVALLFAHPLVTGDGANRYALPLAYALCLIGAAVVFARWRFTWRLAPALVSPLAAMTALTFAWARWDLAPEWYPSFAAAAALGYVAISWLDRQGRAVLWAQLSLLCGAGAVLGAHAAVLPDDVSRWPLVLVYAEALAGAAAVFAIWRFMWRLGPGLVPPLAAMTALTFAWAQWDLAPEWYPSFAAAAGLGFLALAWFDDQKFARLWGGWFALGAAGAVAGAHPAVLLDDASRWALPLAYAIVLAGLGFSFWKWRWAESGGFLPPATAMTALAASWARWDLAPEWFGAFAAGTAFGYIALARFDRPERRLEWWSGAIGGAVVGIALAHAFVAIDGEASRYAIPLTYGISLLAAATAFVTWRFAWRVAPAAIPALASATALSFAWARWDTELWWWGAFIVPAAYGYIALALADEKSRAKAWLSGSALAAAVGVTLAQGMQADTLATHRALPVTYGEALLACAFVVAWWRFSAREAVVALPPLAAAFGASTGWAEFGMRLDWLTAWGAAVGAAYFIPAYFEARYRDSWRLVAMAVMAVALLGAHSRALEPDAVRWPLAVSYGVILLAWAWHAIALRDQTVIGPPLLASAFGASTLWAAGAGPEWWAYPALAVAAGMAGAEAWLRRVAFIDRWLWLYAVALSVLATVASLPVNYTHPGHGLATQLVTAAVLFAGAWRSGSTIVRAFQPDATPFVLRSERIGLTQAGFAFLFGAAASLNGVLDLAGADRAWALTAVALIPWVILATPFFKRDAIWTFVPIGLAGMTIAGALASSDDGVLTAVLAAGALGPVVACVGMRRWALLGIANSFLMLAIWSGWRWAGIDMAYLPLGYAAVAVAEWGLLTGLRKYSPQPGESALVIAYLSWGPWLIAGGVAGALLARKQNELEPGTSLLTTAEWALAAAVLAMVSAAVTGEGLRLWKRWVWTGGSAGLLAALLMGIATYEPGNVQAYTAPIGAYLAFIGLTFRRTPEVFREHLLAHEAVMLIGAAFLVFPPAEQSFAPGGGYYGLELIGIAIVMIGVGVVLHGRWLVAAGIATLTATSMRMVTGGLFSTPYWLLLGIGGTALIGFGVLVLLERERWDRFRHRVVAWWEETASKGPPADTTGLAN